jgi:hypothetical protein
VTACPPFRYHIPAVTIASTAITAPQTYTKKLRILLTWMTAGIMAMRNGRQIRAVDSNANDVSIVEPSS